MRYFRKDTVLWDDEFTNAYGIHSSSGSLLWHSEVIDYFRKLKVTQEELEELNDYILQSPFHSFYDNVFDVYDDCGYPCNFIIGYRLSKDRKPSEEELEVIRYEEEFRNTILSMKACCRHDGCEWEALIRKVEIFSGYYILTIEGMGSSIRTYIGNSSEYWVMFPDFNLGTSIADPWNKQWNIEKLTMVFGNSYDAISVASIIEVFGNQIPILW